MHYKLDLCVRDAAAIDAAIVIVKNDLPHAKEVWILLEGYDFDSNGSRLVLRWNCFANDTEHSRVDFRLSESNVTAQCLVIIEVVATYAQRCTVLELYRNGNDVFPFLRDIFRQFGKAGYWAGTLKTLYLKRWNLSREPCIVSNLGSFPSNLEELHYDVWSRHGYNLNGSWRAMYNRNVDGEFFREIFASQLNRFIKNLPNLRLLCAFVDCWRSTRSTWLAPALLEGLYETSPHLSIVSVTDYFLHEFPSENEVVLDHEVRSLCFTLTNLPKLKSLSFRMRPLASQWTDQIIAAVLSPETNILDNFQISGKPGHGGIAHVASYLSTADNNLNLLSFNGQLTAGECAPILDPLRSRLGVWAENDELPGPKLNFEQCHNEYRRLLVYKKIFEAKFAHARPQKKSNVAYEYLTCIS
jgi:hypothetical protein